MMGGSHGDRVSSRVTNLGHVATRGGHTIMKILQSALVRLDLKLSICRRSFALLNDWSERKLKKRSRHRVMMYRDFFQETQVILI